LPPRIRPELRAQRLSIHFAESGQRQLLDKPAKASSLTEEKDEEVLGAEVGVGEDWGHLNKRRRRAREEKVKKDVKWMNKVSKARRSNTL